MPARLLPVVRALAAAAGALALAAALSSCSSTVALEPAPDANDPACAAVSARLPAVVDGADRRWTDAQATGAWGTPTSVILTCGVEVPGPTTQQCQTVGGVDWVIDESDAPRYTFTTFGRVPAVAVFFDNEVVVSSEVITPLSAIVASLPTNGLSCVERPTD